MRRILGSPFTILIALALLGAACGSDAETGLADSLDSAGDSGNNVTDEIDGDDNMTSEAQTDEGDQADPGPANDDPEQTVTDQNASASTDDETDMADPAQTDPADDSAPSESAESPDDAEIAEGQSLASALNGRFIEGALVSVSDPAPCTLSSGAESTCQTVTVAGYPPNREAGPFCPATTDATAEDAGIWLDGENLYDVDGEFILALPEIYDDPAWRLHEDDGSVRITDTPEAFDGAARPNVDPEYQNHCVEGRLEWLTNGEPVPSTVVIPLVPVAADAPAAVGAQIGVTFEGVTIDGAAPVDAILGAYTIAAFDDCGGHFNPVAGYHIHAATGCAEVGDAPDGETPAFGIALDGHPIHSPLSPEAAAAAGLDECNGHETEELGYHYHARSPELNGVLSCLTGQSVSGGAGGAGNRPPRPARDG